MSPSDSQKTETRSGAYARIGPSLAAARVQTLGVRPSIRGLMIAVAVLAGLFSVRSLWSVIVLAFVCPGFALIGARWLLSPRLQATHGNLVRDRGDNGQTRSTLLLASTQLRSF